MNEFVVVERKGGAFGCFTSKGRFVPRLDLHGDRRGWLAIVRAYRVGGRKWRRRGREDPCEGFFLKLKERWRI